MWMLLKWTIRPLHSLHRAISHCLNCVSVWEEGEAWRSHTTWYLWIHTHICIHCSWHITQYNTGRHRHMLNFLFKLNYPRVHVTLLLQHLLTISMLTPWPIMRSVVSFVLTLSFVVHVVVLAGSMSACRTWDSSCREATSVTASLLWLKH